MGGINFISMLGVGVLAVIAMYVIDKK